MKKLWLCLLTIFLFIFMSSKAQAILIFNQPPYSEAGGLTSGPDPLMGEPARVYDDFTLTTTSIINGINWWGFYSYKYPAPAGPAFTVRFYSDDGGYPGSSFTQVGYGSLTIGNYTFSDNTVISTYSIALDSSFTAAAGTKYWLSIYNTAGNNSLWGWQIADPLYHVYDGVEFGSIQDPQFEPYPSNVAFQLTYETPVPIPPAAWLLGAGLIALVVIRRRIRAA